MDTIEKPLSISLNMSKKGKQRNEVCLERAAHRGHCITAFGGNVRSIFMEQGIIVEEIIAKNIYID